MKFFKAVREGKVVGPLRHSFCEEQWRHNYLERGGDRQSEAVFLAGLDIARRNSALLSVLPGPLPISAIKHLVGIVNREMVVVYIRTRDATLALVNNDIIRSDDVAQLGLALSEGGIYSPDEIVQTVTDAFTVMADYVEQRHSQHSCYDYQVVNRLTALAGHYVLLQNLWGRCLWGEYQFEGNSYRPIDREWYAMWQVSDFRRSLIIQQVAVMAHLVWDKMLSMDERRARTRVKVVLGITREGDRTSYQLGHRSVATGTSPPSSFVSRLQAEEIYYSSLLDESLPRAGGVSARQLLDAWEVLHSVAEWELGSFPEPREHEYLERLEQYSPTFTRNQLETLLQEGVGFTKEEANHVIDYLEFRRGSDPYLRPLVNVGDGNYSLLLAPILFGNMLRTLEQWMKLGGIQLSEKGGAFEVQIREGVKRRRFPLNRAYFSPNGVSFRGRDGKTEQIDFVVAMPKQIFVIEMKCYIFPQSPMERARFKAKISKAAGQVRRKANFLENNRSALRGVVPEGIIEGSEFSVHPVVVVNTALGSGFCIDGVPVVDSQIFKNYFSEGMLTTSVVSRDKIEERETMYFYKTEEEAYHNFLPYLCSPPQTNLFANYVESTSLPIPGIGGLSSAAFEELRIRIPGDFSIAN